MDKSYIYHTVSFHYLSECLWSDECKVRIKTLQITIIYIDTHLFSTILYELSYMTTYMTSN